MSISEEKIYEYQKIYRYRIYLKIRKEIDKIKKKHGFKCKFPKCYCCTSLLHFYPEDYMFMKEKNLDTSGLDVEFDEKGEVFYISDKTKEKERFNKKGEKIFLSHICYYEIIDENQENLSCSLHPNNPLLCHTFPIVLRLEDVEILEKAYHCRQKTKMKLTKKEKLKLYRLMRKYNKFNI